jgi:hypothetical protein
MKLDLSKPFDLNRANLYYAKLRTDGSKIELKVVRESRTLKQNAYLHVCITLFAIEFGYTIEEAKTDLKRYCSFMRYEKNGNQYLKETRGLNTKELTEFIEWIRTYSAQEGCYIPTSEEYINQRFEIDKQISNHKEYL